MSSITHGWDLGTATVNALVREHPQTVEVFSRFGIDACCGGSASVRAAAERDGADLATLLLSLREAIGR